MNRELGTSAAALWQRLRAPWRQQASWQRLPGARHGPGCSGSARPRAWVRREWLSLLVGALLGLAGLAFGLKHRHTLYKRGQDVASAVRYRLDAELSGRHHESDPAPTCCLDEGCLPQGLQATRGTSQARGRAAVVTYVRSGEYLPLFWQLECTLRRSNPGLELALMLVEGELEAAAVERIHAAGVTLLPVDPLEFKNVYESRNGKNWLKIRAFDLVQYDSVLLLDSDVAVVRPLQELFSLPTHFAAVLDQGAGLHGSKTGGFSMLQAGVLLLRPCPATAQHMLSLLREQPKLRFPHGNAEQDFFSWYFRHTALTLPLEYNTMSSPSLKGNLTVGGVPPKVVHFTSNKPWGGPQPGSPGHQFLCSSQELAARQRHALPSTE